MEDTPSFTPRIHDCDDDGGGAKKANGSRRSSQKGGGTQPTTSRRSFSPASERAIQSALHKGGTLLPGAICVGTLRKGKEELWCQLVGPYMFYQKLPGSPKLLNVADANIVYESKSLAIRLTKASTAGAETTKEARSYLKQFVCPTEKEFFRWQAVLRRAVALWSLPRHAAAAAVPQGDVPLLVLLFRQLLTVWSFITIGYGTGLLTSAVFLCAVHPIRERSPSRVWEFMHTLVTSVPCVTRAEFSCAMVTAYTELQYSLPNAVAFALETIATMRNVSPSVKDKYVNSSGLRERLRALGLQFTNNLLRFTPDLAEHVWPRLQLKDGEHASLMQAFRLWISSTPVAPWSSILRLTRQHLISATTNVLGMSPQNTNKPVGPGLNGIRNAGNTCYANSLLQCLLHTPQFMRFFLIKAHRLFTTQVGQVTSTAATAPSRTADAPPPLSQALSRLTQEMWSTATPLDADDVLQVIRSYRKGSFAEGNQHDAHELLVAVFDVLNEELCQGRSDGATPRTLPCYTSDRLSEEELLRTWRRAYLMENNSFITHYFTGQEMQRARCSHCGVHSYCCDSFTFLFAPVVSHCNSSAVEMGANGGGESANDKPPALSGRTPSPPVSNGDDRDGSVTPPGAVRLTDCLASYFQQEQLNMDTGSVCDRCKKPLPVAERTLSLHRLPPYLIVCLNRFEVNDAGRAIRKREAAVEVTDTLSLRPWLRRGAMLPIIEESGSVCWYSDGHDYDGYELYAAVLHRGSVNAGHYIALCRVGAGWWQFNDSVVTYAGPDVASWASERAKEVYILFYRSMAGDHAGEEAERMVVQKVNKPATTQKG